MRDTIKQRIEQVRRGEVPKGYQRNKSFISPNDWELLPLNTVLFENKERNFNKKYSKGDVLSVSGESGVVNQIVFMGRSYAGASVDNYHVVETGDLVYTKSPLKENPYGIIKLNCGNPGIVSTLYAVYHCQKPYTAQYLNQYFCIDRYLNNYLKPLVKRGAKNDIKVNNDDVIRGHIAFPSDAEQQKMIKILAQCDKVIALKQELLEEKRKQKKWLMQKLLDSDSGVRLSNYGNDWNYKSFDEIVSLSKEKVDPQTCGTYYPCIELEHIESGTGRLLGWTDSGKQASIKTVFKSGDILFGKLRPYLRKIVKASFDGVCSGEIWVIQLRCKDICSDFLFYLMQGDRFIATANTTTGTKMPRVDWSLLKDFEIGFPEYAEQTAIAKVLSTADKEIDLLKQELAAWKEKKKGLAQLLLTGLVRV